MTQDEIIALIRSCATETVDWDLHGNKLTDADVALWSTHGPLMLRVVRAVQRQAYERAAEVCEIECGEYFDSYELRQPNNNDCADAIRALIEGDGK